MKVAPRGSFAALCLITAALAAIRLIAAQRVGFGDSEALYASYALFPQPCYVDHPGLIGLFARAIGGASAPTPRAAHLATTALAAAIPLIGGLTARAFGARWATCCGAAIAFAVVPEMAIGLFAMTPDLLLGSAWLATLACTAWGLGARPGTPRAVVALLCAGLFVGIACASKVSGAALGAAIVATYLARAARPHAKTIWPWAGLCAGAVIVLPIALFEHKTGYLMLRHRLIDTQAEAALSLRNLAAVVFGQLAYLSPPGAIAAGLAAIDLTRRRDDDIGTRLLFFAFAIPLAMLLPLSLWSRVAEPHWVAPALLVLPIHLARRLDQGYRVVSSRLARATVAVSIAATVAVHAWVLVPSLVRLLPASFDPRFDLANELIGWPQVASRVQQAVIAVEGSGDRTVVVGPHWIVCAQLRAALPRSVNVGCATPLRDDFDAWAPRSTWRRADAVIFVGDNRFDIGPEAILRDRMLVTREPVVVERGGRVARRFDISIWKARATAVGSDREAPAAETTPTPERPARQLTAASP